MEHLLAKLKELETRDFEVVVSRGSLALQQTQRNQAKAEVIQAIFQDIQKAIEPEGYEMYQTEYGPVLEFLNDKVEQKILKMVKKGEEDVYSGFISIQIDAVMKNLDTNAAHDEITYFETIEQKRLREEEKEKAKLNKTQKDAEIRAEKARRREEEIARIEAMKQDRMFEKGEL